MKGRHHRPAQRRLPSISWKLPKLDIGQGLTFGVCTLVILLLVVIAHLAQEPATPATASPATLATGDTCGLYNNSGPDWRFSDGTSLYETMRGVRCTLDADFTLVGLPKGESETCVDAQGKVTKLVVGSEVAITECGPGRLVITGESVEHLFDLSPEMRWFALAAGSAQMQFDITDPRTILCVGGYAVAATGYLSTEQLMVDLQTVSHKDEDNLDIVRGGIWLLAQSLPVDGCIAPRAFHKTGGGH